MTKPLIRIHNLETDEILDREMTNQEYKIYQAEQEDLATQKAQAQAKAEAKAALLERLGITADEAALLLG
jgi:glycogen synthase